MKYLTTALTLLVCHVMVYSQSFYAHRFEDQNYISFGLGTAGYYGDLQHQLIIPFPAASLELSHKLGPQVKIREGLSYFLLRAKDSNQKQQDLKDRNLSFKSANIELSLTFELLFLPIYSYRGRPKVNPFIFGGIGGVTVNPRTTLNGKSHNLRKYKTEGKRYSGLALAIPIGLGIEFAIARYVTLISEFGYRFTTTDYLDDVSTVYTDLSPGDGIRYRLADRTPEMGIAPKKAGMIRGNPKVNDGYAIFSFKLQYNLAQIF
ncbi:MAG: hypothetical protein HEP71_31500 [Roseivirga sp.]|nr:hypothetical protein [Roseivirga sp.]